MNVLRVRSPWGARYQNCDLELYADIFISSNADKCDVVSPRVSHRVTCHGKQLVGVLIGFVATFEPKVLIGFVASYEPKVSIGNRVCEELVT